MEVRCFASLEDAAFLRDEVNGLNQRSVLPGPFSTFEFYENFCLHDEDYPSGCGRDVWFLAAFDAGRLIGYLALARVSRRVLGVDTSMLSFLVVHDSDRPHVVASAADLAAVSESFYCHILQRGREWSLLELQQQDAASTLYPPPSTLELGGYMVREWPGMENATIHLRWNSLDEYVSAMARKFRTNIGRQMHHLLAAGNVEVLASADPATTPALFDLYCGIEPRSWKSHAGAHIARHPQRLAYFRGLLDPAQPMQVSIHVLLLDGLPIAGLISGRFMGRYYLLSIVHDDAFGRCAPGSALLLMGLREAMATHCVSCNMLSGFGYYKVRWLADITTTRIAQIYRVGRLPYWSRRCGDLLRRARGLLRAGESAVAGGCNPVLSDTGRNAAKRAANAHRRPVAPSVPQRLEAAALIAGVRSSACEILSSRELRTLMPFAARG